MAELVDYSSAFNTVELEVVRESNIPLWGGGGRSVRQPRSSATSAAEGGINSPASSLFWNSSPTALHRRCSQASNKTCSLPPSGWRCWRVKYSTSGHWLLILAIYRCHLCATPTVVFLQCFSFTCNFQCLLTVNLHMELVLHYSWHFCINELDRYSPLFLAFIVVHS